MSAVVPAPMNGSSTTPSDGQPASMQGRIKSGGKVAKCAPLKPLVGTVHTGYCSEISAAYQINDLPEGKDHCSTCALKEFPETLQILNFGEPAMAPQVSWEDLASCFSYCLMGCASAPICIIPWACAGCVAICTGVCYGLSTAVCIAPYSYAEQTYVDPYLISY